MFYPDPFEGKRVSPKSTNKSFVILKSDSGRFMTARIALRAYWCARGKTGRSCFRRSVHRRQSSRNNRTYNKSEFIMSLEYTSRVRRILVPVSQVDLYISRENFWCNFSRCYIFFNFGEPLILRFTSNGTTGEQKSSLWVC